MTDTHDGIQSSDSSVSVTFERKPCFVFRFIYSLPYSAIAPGISLPKRVSVTGLPNPCALIYTKVTAPISGRIGKSTVTEGALVTNGQTTELATVQQLDPIYVDVTQSSNDFMRLKQSVEQGNLHKENATSNVELVMENGQTYPLKGTLQFSDVTVDESTGSITLRAVFPNPQHTLLPGMFVRARIDEGVQPDAILIPQQGVSRTPRGDATVLIVNDKSQVEARPVVASQAIGDKWLISEGLKSGDQVIVSGLQKARPGEQVKATTDTPADTASK